MELDHLTIAEKAVREGERHSDREEQMIADLDRAGHDTKQAVASLAVLRRMQAEHVAHRNLLLRCCNSMPARVRYSGRDITRAHQSRARDEWSYSREFTLSLS